MTSAAVTGARIAESSASHARVKNRLAFRPYSTYCNSDIEWMGDIPVDWNIKPMFSVARESKLSNTGMVEDNLLSLSYGRIKRKDIDTLGGLLPESFETYQVVNKNDLIFRLTDLQNDKRSLRTAICTERGIITSAYVAVTPTKIEPHYFAYLMRAYDELKVFYNLGSGMRQSLKYDELKRLPIVLPPNELQQIIVAFLDRETARIDNLIAEKQNFINLLKEKRQALISHVVTKGLNPKVRMKDSGVEWIGEVPEHWAVKKLKHISTIVDCKNRTPEYFENGSYLVVRTSNVRNQKLVLDNALYTEEECFHIWTLRGVPPVGSILFTREAPAGEVCLVPEGIPLCMGQRMMNLILHDAEQTRFVLHYLTSDSVKKYIEMESSGSTVAHLRVGQVYDIPVPVPPNEEIEGIVAFVDKEIEKINRLEKETLKSVELLKEHRTTLISAAVTGKIDVRDLA